jgi:hypothetical protein
MKIWSGFEALVVRILEVKIDYNFAARFKSYSIFKKQHVLSAYHFYYLRTHGLRPPGTSV